MNYPQNCIKGIPDGSFLTEDGSIGAHLFYFKTERSGNDGWVEQSINWEDDGTVVDFTLSQQRGDGEFQFRAGIAIIPRNEIDRLNTLHAIQGLLFYERHPLANNPYHGNILLKASVQKPTMKKIAAGLALIVSKTIAPRSDSVTG